MCSTEGLLNLERWDKGLEFAGGANTRLSLNRSVWAAAGEAGRGNRDYT